MGTNDTETLRAISIAGTEARPHGQRNLFREWTLIADKDHEGDQQVHLVLKMLNRPGCTIRQYVKHFSLGHHDGLNLRGLLELIKALEQLKTFKLFGCKIATNGALCEQRSDTLRELHMKSIMVPDGESTVVVEELFKLSSSWKCISLDDIHFPQGRVLSLLPMNTEALKISYRLCSDTLTIATRNDTSLSHLTVEYAKACHALPLALIVKNSSNTLETIDLGSGLMSEDFADITGMARTFTLLSSQLIACCRPIARLEPDVRCFARLLQYQGSTVEFCIVSRWNRRIDSQIIRACSANDGCSATKVGDPEVGLRSWEWGRHRTLVHSAD